MTDGNCGCGNRYWYHDDGYHVGKCSTCYRTWCKAQAEADKRMRALSLDVKQVSEDAAMLWPRLRYRGCTTLVGVRMACIPEER